MEHSDFTSIRDDLRAVLVRAQGRRRERSEFIDGELEWVTHERQVMFDAVNRIRREGGKSDVTMDAIRRVEMAASGHSDYTRKFVLYCAELVSGDEKGERG